MKKHYLIILLALLGWGADGLAQVRTATPVFTGSNLFPFSGVVRHGQYLYAPGDFQSTTLRSGVVDTIFFVRSGSNPTVQGDNTITDIVIGVMQDTLSQFPNNNYLTGFTTVYSAGTMIIPQGNDFEPYAIPLQQTFTYDSTKSLIIDIVYTSNSGNAKGWASGTNTARRITASATAASPNLQNTQASFIMNVQATPTSNRVRMQTAQLALHPNPATDAATLQLPTGMQAPSQLEVYNCSGACLKVPCQMTGPNAAQLDLRQLPAGLYELALPHGSAVYRARLVRE